MSLLNQTREDLTKQNDSRETRNRTVVDSHIQNTHKSFNIYHMMRQVMYIQEWLHRNLPTQQPLFDHTQSTGSVRFLTK